MKEKINLGKVAKQVLKCEEPWALQLKLAEGVNFKEIEDICLEFGKQLLELAAENATASEYWGNDITEPQLVVDKQSILDTIKQVE